LLIAKRKSQLAIKYAYQTREQSPETWVFWVHASNAARFEQSFRDIADCIKISGRLDPKANIFKLVHDWLRDSKDRWLLILDNVDDARFLLGVSASGQGQPADDPRTTSRQLREYLPTCERGSILVTTRNKEAALKLVDQRDVVLVEPMDKVQALTLFKKKLGAQGNSSDSDDIAELVAALDYMPLAIVQAAAYILQRAPRYSVAKYLREFRKSERKRSSLLTYDDDGQLWQSNEFRRDPEAKNLIIVTWQMSFEYIQQIRPSAANLLSLMSFFDRQGIPETLLQSQSEQGDASQSQKGHGDNNWDSDEEDDASQSSAGNEEFEHDLVTLRNFCLISIDTKGTSFEMHSLVQLATRKWLDSSGKLEQWKQRFINNLCAAFPAGHYENWPTCQALFAHVKSAVEQQPKEKSSLAAWATLLYNAAWYAGTAGNIADAVMLAEKLLKARKKVLGPEHEDTLSSISVVAKAYSADGRWHTAEELLIQVVETYKKKLGADHLDTLGSMNNLALTYQEQGQWDAAEELLVQVVESFGKKLGADHPDTLLSMNNLALTYLEQGRWDAAEELLVQVVESFGKKLGADHPDTLLSINNLASTYRNQERCDAAEELELQVLETRKKKLGADHPDTLGSMNNLAITWKKQRRTAEAIDLMRECVRLSQLVLQPNHPHTVSSSVVLAVWEAEQLDTYSTSQDGYMMLESDGEDG
jgi:tetratricopeptide (TPR) repeat protein